jgi:hypothetical protein
MVLLLVLSTSATAQRGELWSNPTLTARGVEPGEQQLLLRRDLSHCHGAAFEGTRGADEEKREALGVALFKRCMAEKGWSARDPTARKPAPKAPRPTST